MKKITKQLLTIFTALVLGIGLVGSLSSFDAEAATTYTSGDWTYTVYDNVATLTGYTGSATNFTLPTSLGGYKVEAVGKSAFQNNISIICVDIPEGFVTIDNYAFMGCSNLKSVSIPKSIKAIGTASYHGQTFLGCIRLETVNFAEGGTAEVIIQSNTFNGCSALKSVTIPANYKTIGDKAFIGCTNLKTVIIKENADPYFERNILKNAFENCTALISIDIPEGFVTIDNYAFMGCSNLKSVSIPKSIKAIGTASYHGQTFLGCIRLETVNFAEGGTAEVIIQSNTFNGCSALKSVTIPANYKTIGDKAFIGCINLKTVIIKENADPYFERSISENAFESCSSLTTVHIPEIFSGIGDNAFTNCSSSLVICSTSSDCVAKTYADENSITFKVCDGKHETETIKTYTLTYNANGGTGVPSSQSGASSYIISSVTPSRSGYTFLGWSKSSSATSATYLKGNTITLTANTVLYAVWQKNEVVTPPEVENEYEYDVTIAIANPSTTTISYGDSIILHAEVMGNLPAGATIQWYADNGNFDKVAANDGMTCRITPKSSGDTTFTIKVVAADGEVIAEDTQVMTSKAGLFDKIIGFFKKLFGLTKTIPQAFKRIF